MPATPYLDLDLTVVRDRYLALKGLLPELEIAYAVKANSHESVLNSLAALGASFDVASAGELRQVFPLVSSPNLIEYSHPIKSIIDLEFARSLGVSRFTADDAQEVRKIARYCPGARILIRIEVDHRGAAWPLADKFGTTDLEAVSLLRLAADNGVVPVGITFHVGSQQLNPRSYTAALSKVAAIAQNALMDGITISEVNIGGGLPAFTTNDGVPLLEDYVEAIKDGLVLFDNPVHLVAEPGRYLVADAGQLHTSVIGCANRGGQKWVYLDAGVYHGLGETAAIGARFSSNSRGEPALAILAGPTCDSVDVLYDRQPQVVPGNLSTGDELVFHGAGAYTLPTSTQFNGFSAPSVRVRELNEGDTGN